MEIPAIKILVLTNLHFNMKFCYLSMRAELTARTDKKFREYFEKINFVKKLISRKNHKYPAINFIKALKCNHHR